jgi:gliding motility-associated-like protein
MVIGSIPEANFTYSPSPVCEGRPVSFLDSSYVEFGTMNKWMWTVGTQSFISQNPPPLELTGTNQVSLGVETLEGCVSTLKTGTVTSFPVPQVDFIFSDICVTEPSIFKAINYTSSVPVHEWRWKLGDGTARMSASPQFQYQYKHGGVYDVQLEGLTKDGCLSLPVQKEIRVYETNAFAGNDTIIAIDQSVMLNGSGGEIYKWTPATGLSADNIPNPVAVLKTDAQFVLTASTTAGCATVDTVKIKVYKGPAFYVPSAFSPNNDGMNDRFQFIAVGMKTVDMFRVYNRYGQLIYSSTNMKAGWDGRLGGILQASGTYVWIIKGVDFNGVTQSKRGTVTLIR